MRGFRIWPMDHRLNLTPAFHLVRCVCTCVLASFAKGTGAPLRTPSRRRFQPGRWLPLTDPRSAGASRGPPGHGRSSRSCETTRRVRLPGQRSALQVCTPFWVNVGVCISYTVNGKPAVYSLQRVPDTAACRVIDDKSLFRRNIYILHIA